jgi:hypothetical protein
MSARPASRVIYVATGERHIKEAGHSLRSLWRHEPWLPVTIYIDRNLDIVSRSVPTSRERERNQNEGRKVS